MTDLCTMCGAYWDCECRNLRAKVTEAYGKLVGEKAPQDQTDMIRRAIANVPDEVIDRMAETALSEKLPSKEELLGNIAQLSMKRAIDNLRALGVDP